MLDLDQGRERERRTLHVVPRIRIRTLVVVDHLHDLQEIILREFLQSVGEFVHIDLVKVSVCVTPEDWVSFAYRLVQLLLLLHALLARGSTLGLDPILITRNGARLTEPLQQGGLGIPKRLVQNVSTATKDNEKKKKKVTRTITGFDSYRLC